MFTLTRSLFLCTVLLAATACGGGGGDDVAGAREDFAKESQTMAGLIMEPNSLVGVFGGGSDPTRVTKPADGASALRTGTFEFREASVNRDGIAGSLDLQATFRVEGDGAFEFSSPDNAPNGTGGVGPQHELAMLANGTPGKPPQLLAFVRSQSQSEVEEFAGVYHRLRLERSINSGDFSAFYHRATLDGGNTASFETGLRNSEGAVTASVVPPLPYEFDRKSILLDRPSAFLVGRSTSDGGVILFSALGAATPTQLQVWIRRADNATLDAIRGTYRVGFLHQQGLVSSGAGTLVLEGDGTGTLQMTVTDGSQSGLIDEPITYAVAADGTFDLFREDGRQLRGGVSADGRMGALMDVSPQTAASLWIVVRR